MSEIDLEAIKAQIHVKSKCIDDLQRSIKQRAKDVKQLKEKIEGLERLITCYESSHELLQNVIAIKY